ncbi:hypothetical protein RF55_14504, partial [Lasius niger]
MMTRVASNNPKGVE